MASVQGMGKGLCSMASIASISSGMIGPSETSTRLA